MNTTVDSIKVHYDGNGQDIKSHQMKSSYVSGSIIALESIYKESYKEANKLYKSKIQTEVLVQGGFSEGSLWWIMKFLHKENEKQVSTGNQDIHLMISNGIGKIVSIIKRLSPSVTDITINESSDGYSVFVDGEAIIINEIECAMLTNTHIRSALSKLAEPLQDEGIDTLTINNSHPNHKAITIEKENAGNFAISRNHTTIIEDGEIFGFYKVESLSYNPNSKWKFVSINSPSDNFSSTIDDESFWVSVAENKEKFSKDDVLEIHGTWIREKKKLTGKSTVFYKVTEIKDHIPYEDVQWKLL